MVDASDEIEVVHMGLLLLLEIVLVKDSDQNLCQFVCKLFFQSLGLLLDLLDF